MPPHPFDPIDVSPESIPADTSSEYLGRAASSWRIGVAFVLLIAGCAALLARSFHLQVIRADTFAVAAERNRSRSDILVPTRGIITDRHGTPLVRNVPRYTIGVIPADLSMVDAASVERLARVVGVTPDALRDALHRYPRFLTEPIAVRDDLSYDDASRMLVAAETTAVQLIVTEQRDYRRPSGRDLESLSHVMGYVGRVSPEEYTTLASQRYRASDRIGKTGIEAQYEQHLRGTSGMRTVVVDARGRTAATPAMEPPIAGQTLTLTIDLALQETAERALRAGLQRVGARRGAAIAMDPRNGEILALVSVPSFSSSAVAAGISPTDYAALVQNADHPLFPRAIAGTYPSGSTIKPVVAAAALSAGIITSSTSVLSTGGLRVGTSFFPDWREGGHGWVTVTEALAQSVNTFFYVIGGGWPRATVPRGGPSQSDALGPERLAEAFRAFGFGAITGIDIPGEVPGIVPTPAWKEQERGEPWYIGDTYHLAIGQGDLLVTPLQVAVATAPFANEGRRAVPRLVADASVNQATSESGAMDGTPVAGITDVAIAAVRRGMRAAVLEGSARGLASLPLTVFGKTGTAQTTPNRRSHAWFTGFAETSPQPTASSRKLVVTVLVEEGGDGSAVAVPIAREIFSAWVQ